MKKVTLLLWSWFSIPYWFPSMKNINNILANLTIDDFYFYSDSNIIFGEKLNWMFDPHEYRKAFILDFINQFFNESQWYEKFFDFIIEQYRLWNSLKKSVDVINICKKNRKEKNHWIDDLNLLSKLVDFVNAFIFHQLSRDELHDNTIHKMDYDTYNLFVKFLKNSINKWYNLDIYTLNHDLLFDHILETTMLSNDFSDWFTTKWSKYFSDVYTNIWDNKKQSVEARVKIYNWDYQEKPIKFYKLHWSINTYFTENWKTWGRVKLPYWAQSYYLDDWDKINNLDHYSYIPNFLSWTTNKIRHYDDPYYKELFEAFENDLSLCKMCISIWYGFWDLKINEYLEENILKQKKTLHVIKPSPLEIKNITTQNKSLYQWWNIKETNKSIKDITWDKWDKIILNLE